jgi:hypothetical protein
MRKMLIAGAAAGLIALPAAAIAETGEPVVETDPAAESQKGPTTDKALHSEGVGAFEYEGSGGVTVTVTGAVTVVDLSPTKDLVRTPAGFGALTTSKDGLRTRYRGTGTLTLDGSQYRVRVHGKLTVDIDPTAAHAAIGTAHDWGAGATTLKGGVAQPFWRDQDKLLVGPGALSVDLAGHGGVRWHRGPKGHGGKSVRVREVVVTRRFVNGKRVFSRRVVTQRRWWQWDPREPGATWRLNGPVSGEVIFKTLSGRLRVWDKSPTGTGGVTVGGIPAGTPTITLADKSVVYLHLRGAPVTLTGTAFRMKAVGTDVEGSFAPTAGTLARSFVRGRGTLDTADATDLRAHKHGGTRLLLQPAPAPK